MWTSDHFQPWRHTGGHAPNALVWLGAAAASTTHVTLGTSVLTPSFRYNPAIVAQAFATLSCLAEGRIILGVGTGESMNEVPVGIDWPDQSERFARLREAITLIKQLWAEEFVNFEGEYFRTHDATVYDRPKIPVPIYVAASGPAAARLAGRIGDGFICTSGKGEELYTQTLLPSLAEGAEKAGRDVSGMDRMIEMKVSFDTDFDQAMEDTKVWAALALPGDKKMGVHDPREMEVLAKEAEPYAHTRWLVSSDPDEHVEQIAPVHRLGLQPPRVPLPGRGAGGGDRAATASRSCRGCAPASADRRAAAQPRGHPPAGRTQTDGLDPCDDLAVVAGDPHVHAHDHVPGPARHGDRHLRRSTRHANARCHVGAVAPLRVVELLEPQDLPAWVHGERELVAGERDERRRVGQVADVVHPGWSRTSGARLTPSSRRSAPRHRSAPARRAGRPARAGRGTAAAGGSKSGVTIDVRARRRSRDGRRVRRRVGFAGASRSRSDAVAPRPATALGDRRRRTGRDAHSEDGRANPCARLRAE